MGVSVRALGAFASRFSSGMTKITVSSIANTIITEENCGSHTENLISELNRDPR